jgi:UDP-4-amino-4,6-dideoxy-L-N-acetyl-beta-L-altrosamine transaminase
VTKNLPISNGRQFVSKKNISVVKKALKNNFLANGPLCLKFENKIKKKLNCRYVLACNSGTSALYLSIKSLKLKKGASVIMPAINFIAAANVCTLLNLKIYLADVDKETGQLTVNEVRRCIKMNNIKNLKVIINMYLAGSPRDIISFYKLKKELSCYLIEDACHAFGAKYTYKKTYYIGSCKHADISTFSFHPLKSITTGEGGAITTNSRLIYNNAKLIRSHGIQKKKNHWNYDVVEAGLNLRLSEINAALGLSQLSELSKFIAKRKKIYNYYIKHINLFKNYVKIIQTENKTFPSFHLVLANINFKKLKLSKESFLLKMKKKNIFIHYHYIPIFLFKYYKSNKKKFPNSMYFYRNTFSLPIFYILNINQLKRTIAAIKEIILEKIH